MTCCLYITFDILFSLQIYKFHEQITHQFLAKLRVRHGHKQTGPTAASEHFLQIKILHHARSLFQKSLKILQFLRVSTKLLHVQPHRGVQHCMRFDCLVGKGHM